MTLRYDTPVQRRFEIAGEIDAVRLFGDRMKM